MGARRGAYSERKERRRARRVRCRAFSPRPWLALLLLLLSLASPAPAAEILAVLSARLPPYEAALRGFREALAQLPPAGPKAIQPDTITELSLSEAGPEGLARAVAERRPDLVLAVGRAALAAAAELTGQPVLYLLAPAAGPLARGRPHVTGIELDPAPAAALSAVRSVLPSVRRMGVLYDPARTGALVEAARRAAPGAGASLTALPVRGPREVEGRLAELAGSVDALWLLPDLTVVTPETVEAHLHFSARHRVPVVAFSPTYVERGATLSVSADPDALARQAARLARRLLAGEPPARLPPEPPARVVVTVNRAVAAKLGLAVDPRAPEALEWVE